MLERSNGEDITVQEVADEAGQSLRTLYQYFESKDDLLLAVFEEAMRTYARLIRAAIADLTDPVERLAGAMVAAARMPEYTGSGVDRGLARLRLRLAEAKPDLVGRAQSSLTSLVRELVDDATATGRGTVADPEAATFMLLSLNAAVITSDTLGNDAGVRPPDVSALAGVLPAGPRCRARRGLVRRGDRPPALPVAALDHGPVPPPPSGRRQHDRAGLEVGLEPLGSHLAPDPRRPEAAERVAGLDELTGASGDGFNRIGAPAASAAPSFMHVMNSGTFHGTMPAATPTGTFCTRTRPITPARSAPNGNDSARSANPSSTIAGANT